MKRLGAITALLLIGVTFAIAHQTKDSDDEGRILALEKAWNLALEQRDTSALEMLLDTSLVSVDIDGSRQTKAEFLASIKDPDYQIAQAVTEQSSIQVYGNAAVVTGIFRIKATEKGKTSTHRERFVDTWVKSNHTWECVATTATLITAKPPSE
jgi:ketosteroid isomerase-like protein